MSLTPSLRATWHSSLTLDCNQDHPRQLIPAASLLGRAGGIRVGVAGHGLTELLEANPGPEPRWLPVRAAITDAMVQGGGAARLEFEAAQSATLYALRVQ